MALRERADRGGRLCEIAARPRSDIRPVRWTDAEGRTARAD